MRGAQETNIVSRGTGDALSGSLVNSNVLPAVVVREQTPLPLLKEGN
jgi:hypothetical protein